MRHKEWKKSHFFWLAGVAALVVLSLVTLAVAIKSDAEQKLAAERHKRSRQNEIPFTKVVRKSLDNRHIQFRQNTNNVRAVARFRDSIFAATDGGLVQFSDGGEIIKHFTVLDGLTESDLTCLAAFGDELFIGTGATGLLAFDGERFASFRWRDREAKSVTALLPADGRLLIGTFAGGLIEFDGSRFREVKAENASFPTVNFLAKERNRLFVGTFGQGLWISEAARWQHFDVSSGLLSNRVVGVVADEENVFVGTDLGVVQARNEELFSAVKKDKVFRPIATIPTLSSLIRFDNQIFGSRDDGEIFTLPAKKLDWNRPGEISGARLLLENGKLLLVGNRGILTLRESAAFQFAPFAEKNGTNSASNIISALAVDENGKIWAGNFRNGIDVFSQEGKRLAHLESEIIRDINFLLPEPGGNMLAATSAGVVKFDGAMRQTRITKNDGLLSNSVMHISAGEKSDKNAARDRFFATSLGLSFEKGSELRSLDAVNGLPGNNAYATLVYQNRLFVGTLGGFAEIENGRVSRVWKDSNSKLSHNWVTALCLAAGRIFVGTYGGGVFELTPSGELHDFSSESGKVSVNPNAMWSDGERLYAGTLDGTRILNLTTQKWSELKEELPSKTVLSLTGDAEAIYFGTTGGIARVEKGFFRNE